MNRDHLTQLLEQTFSKLAAPSHAHGMYAELEKALIDAFNLGKAQQESHARLRPMEELSYTGLRA